MLSAARATSKSVAPIAEQPRLRFALLAKALRQSVTFDGDTDSGLRHRLHASLQMRADIWDKHAPVLAERWHRTPQKMPRITSTRRALYISAAALQTAIHTFRLHRLMKA